MQSFDISTGVNTNFPSITLKRLTCFKVREEKQQDNATSKF
jgi:hypothetical protein